MQSIVFWLIIYDSLKQADLGNQVNIRTRLRKNKLHLTVLKDNIFGAFE